MEPDARRPHWKTLLAFAIIYFVWGSTFLAIRIGVHELPPLLFAAMRFLAAGIVLFLWVIAHGEAHSHPPPMGIHLSARVPDICHRLRLPVLG
jgi:drug/metabolite transporter (DMT)-like permease